MIVPKLVLSRHAEDVDGCSEVAFRSYPAGFGHHALTEELEAELGGKWYPIGEWLSSSSVFVDDEGTRAR